MGQLVHHRYSLNNLQLHDNWFFHVMHDCRLGDILQDMNFLVLEPIHIGLLKDIRGVSDHFDSFQKLIFDLEAIEI